MVVITNLHLGHGMVRGDTFSIRRHITRMPSGVTVSSAKLTFKASTADADPGLFQKSITSSNVAGTGHVENIGAGGVATLRFDLVAADTNLATANANYYFDIRVTYSDGTVIALESGITQWREKVTT